MEGPGTEVSRRAVAFVYCLRHPESGLVGYVGVSAHPEVRYYAHLVVGATQYHEAWEKEQWIRTLAAQGLCPLLEILDTVPATDREDAEERWIAHFEDLGHPLTNRWRMNRERRAMLIIRKQRREERAKKALEEQERELRLRQETRGYVPASEAHTLIGCGRTTIYGWIWRGVLPRKQIGHRIWVPVEALLRIAPHGPITFQRGRPRTVATNKQQQRPKQYKSPRKPPDA